MASSFPQPLTEQEEQIYVEKSQQGDAEARGKLIEHNLRLVAHIAKKYTSPGASQDDLISIGTIGLIKAVNTYTASRATRLATYAAKCIENAILSQIRLWFRSNPPPEQKITQMAYSGTGFREYPHPLFHFRRLCEICTHVYP